MGSRAILGVEEKRYSYFYGDLNTDRPVIID